MNDTDTLLCARLLLAAGFLAGGGMPDCALAVVEARDRLLLSDDIPRNSLAAAILSILKTREGMRFGVRIYSPAGELLIETWNIGETVRDVEIEAALSRRDVGYVEWWPHDGSALLTRIYKESKRNGTEK